MLENLNTEQKLAVETTEGPLLVLSGAGTGKTRVLTTRIAYILNMGLAAPWNILALTFTNRAANEMKNRIAEFAGVGTVWNARDLWCGTFHSICLRILRANADAAGLRRDFLVFGEDDQKHVIKDIVSDTGGARQTPAELMERFSAIKDKGLIALSNTDRLYMAYNAELARLNAVDFGDIILKVLQLFDTHPDILERYRRQFKYILVDEFQDTNAAQMQLLEMLTRGVENPNICCVGDDDQSIYSWRGAEIKNILNFDKNYNDAQIIRLETNYRSTSNILGAANSLIRHNSGRLGKDLRAADADGVAEPVYVITVGNDLEEASFVADTILRNGGDLKNYAVLIRAGSLSRLFEEEFSRRAIPFRLVGATKFYDRMEIRDAIAYIRLMVHPFDDVSFLRVISKPRRGIGPGAIDKIRATGAPFLMDGMRRVAFTPKMRAAADDFLNAFDFEWATMPPRDAAQMLLERSGYLKMWRESKDGDATERLDNIRELITGVIAKFDTIDEFLEQAALMTADDDENASANSDAVSVMTIHAAKGLEFDTVFLPGWEESIFPNDKAINEGALEEERRLAYVAITRARRRAVIINAISRMVFGSRQYNSPSRFIYEMDSQFLEMPSAAPRREAFENARMRDVRVAPRKIVRPATMVGKLVEHNEMGRGTVIAENGNVLTIAFGSRGIKNVMRDFVTEV